MIVTECGAQSQLDNTGVGSLLDQIEIGSFTLDKEGYLIAYNNSAAKIFGLHDNPRREELNIAGIDAFIHCGLAEAHANGITSLWCTQQLRCTNREGRFMVLNISCRPDADHNGITHGIVQDLSGLRRPEPGSAEKLALLTEVSEAISSTYELDQILRIIMTAATAAQGLSYNRVFLFLLDHESKFLNGYLAVGPANAEEAGRIWESLEYSQATLSDMLAGFDNRTNLGQSVLTSKVRELKIELTSSAALEKVFAHGDWVIIGEDSSIDDVTAGFLNHLGACKMALVPLISKGRAVGLMAADNLFSKSPVTNEAVKLLQLLANQAAVAIEKAQLCQQQKERALQLEQTNHLLRESQSQVIQIEKISVIGQITSAVARELRNPLSIIGGFANLIVNSETSDDIKQYADIIAGETKRTEKILDHVTEFRKASQTTRSYIDFSKLVQSSLESVVAKNDKQDNSLVVSLTTKRPIVFGNRDQLNYTLQQIFRLIWEEFVNTGRWKWTVRTELLLASVRLTITFIEQDKLANKEKLRKTLAKLFSEHSTSNRLPVVVTVETIKYHRGRFGLSDSENESPTIFIELPLADQQEKS